MTMQPLGAPSIADTVFPSLAQMQRRRLQRKGYLFEKSGYWYVRYRVDKGLDENGVMIRKQIAVQVGHSTGSERIGKREAGRIAWKDCLSKVDQSSIRPGSMVTLEKFYRERFERDWISNLKPSGQYHYRLIFKNHILPELGQTELREITAEHAQKLIRIAQAKKLSGQTCLHVKNCLSAILRHARSLQLLTGDLPTMDVRMPEVCPKARRALTWEQACAISTRIPSVVMDKDPSWLTGKHRLLLEREATEISILVLILAVTGLRIGEAVGLRWRRVNLGIESVLMDEELLPARSLAVRENYVMCRYSTLKTAGSRRIVPLPSWACERLAEIRTRLEWSGPNDPVFASSRGRPIDHHNIVKSVLKPAARLEGLPWVSWHCFRHGNATMADQAGLTVTERMKILGHSSAAMTGHYTHPEIERVRERLDKFCKPITGLIQ